MMGGGGGPGERTNPFRFIEQALNEAKSKIEKMKNTPQILESLPDVSSNCSLVIYTSSDHAVIFCFTGREEEEILES